MKVEKVIIDFYKNGEFVGSQHISKPIQFVNVKEYDRIKVIIVKREPSSGEEYKITDSEEIESEVEESD